MPLNSLLKMAIVGGVAAAAIAYLVALQVAKQAFAKENREFARLAIETRQQQAADASASFLRIFRRTQLQVEHLVMLQEHYEFQKERDLFSETNADEMFKSLSNRSLMFIAMPSRDGVNKRRISWADQRKYEWFFNPMRLISIFISSTQFIICDIELNSATGDLNEEIQRIALSSIVSIRFRGEQSRTSYRVKDLIGAAERLGTDDADLRRIRQMLKNKSEDEDSGWALNTMTSVLAFSRTDGGSISVPIATNLMFGELKPALDQEALGDDEIMIDRMLNELNRLVDQPR